MPAFRNEPFNTYVRKGDAAERIGEVFASIKPEVAYFTTTASRVGRS